eukprot:767532-Hanusia_phi.AAC.5
MIKNWIRSLPSITTPTIPGVISSASQAGLCAVRDSAAWPLSPRLTGFKAWQVSRRRCGVRPTCAPHTAQVIHIAEAGSVERRNGDGGDRTLVEVRREGRGGRVRGKRCSINFTCQG